MTTGIDFDLFLRTMGFINRRSLNCQITDSRWWWPKSRCLRSERCEEGRWGRGRKREIQHWDAGGLPGKGDPATNLSLGCIT